MFDASILKKVNQLKIKLIDGDRGKNYPSKSELFDDGYCLFLDTGNIKSNGFDFTSTKFITKEKDEILRNGKIKRGDIIITTRGTVGNVAIYDNSIKQNEIRINSGMLIIRNVDDKLDTEFLLHFLTTMLFRHQLERFTTGSAQPQITQTIFKEALIPMYNISTQKAIAKVLSDIDAKIELNNKINEKLEAIAKLIYDYWFVQFDFPYPEGLEGQEHLAGKPYKSSGGEMVFNKKLKREIPEGWEVKRLEDIFDNLDSKRVPISKSKREEIQGNIPYYGATSIMDYVNDYLFDERLILLAEDGSVCDEYGFPIIQYIEGKSWINNHAHVLRPKVKKNFEFLFQQLSFTNVTKIISGSIQKKINQTRLNSLFLLMPSQNMVNQFALKLQSNRELIFKLIKQNQQLASLRDWLLPMLMNGQISVLQAEEQIEQEINLAAEEEGEYTTEN